MAGDLNYKATIDVTQAERSLGSLQQKVGGLSDTFIKLKTTLASISLGAIISQANQFALGVDQASRASGVATSTVLGFAKAVSSLGGDANRATGDVIDFVAGLDAAKKGSASAQIDLAKIGITLSDLGRLGNEELFKKTVQGIASIGDASERNRLAVTLLGRSFKDIDVRDVAARMNAGGYVDTASIKSAAEAQRNLSVQMGKFQEAVLSAIKPLNDLIAKIDISTKSFKEFINVLLIVGASIGVIKYIVPILTGIQAALAGVIFEGVALGGVLAGAFAPVIKVAKGLWDALWNIGAAFTMIGGKFTIFERLLLIVTGLVGFFGRFFSIVGWVVTALEVADFALRKLFNIDLLSPAVKWMEDSLSSLMRKAGEFLGIIKPQMGAGAGRGGNDETLKAQQERGAEMRKLAEQEAAAKQKVVDAFRAQRLEQNKIVRDYKLGSDELMTQLTFETSLIGKTEEEQQKRQKMHDFEKTYLNTLVDLDKKRSDMRAAAAVGTDEEKAAYAAFMGSYQSTVNQITKDYEQQRGYLSKLIDANQGAALIEKDRLANLDRITHAYEQQAQRVDALAKAQLDLIGKRQDITFELGLKGMSPLRREIATIQETARKGALEAGRAYAATFEDTGDGMTPERAKELSDGLNLIATGYKDIADSQIKGLKVGADYLAGFPDLTNESMKALLTFQEEFKFGLQESWKEYKDNALDAAKQAKDGFSSFTQGMEDAFVSFVQTGKLSFKSLANSILADLARIAFKRAIVGMASLFGFAAGGSVMGGTPIVVGERGPELFVPQSAGKIVPNNVLNGSAAGQGAVNGGGQTTVNYNIQAVDAASFRSMVARDPSFIYAVTEQGRRSQPTRSR